MNLTVLGSTPLLWHTLLETTTLRFWAATLPSPVELPTLKKGWSPELQGLEPGRGDRHLIVVDGEGLDSRVAHELGGPPQEG